MNEEVKQHKFNLIDALIIIVIIAIFAFCGYKAYTYYNTVIKANNNTSELSTGTYICEIEVKKVSEEVRDQFKPEDKVFNLTSTELGKITKIESSSAQETFLDEASGKIITVMVPDAYDLIITMELTTNPDFIYVGKNLSFKTEYVKTNGFILTRESK